MVKKNFAHAKVLMSSEVDIETLMF